MKCIGLLKEKGKLTPHPPMFKVTRKSLKLKLLFSVVCLFVYLDIRSGVYAHVQLLTLYTLIDIGTKFYSSF